MSAYPNPGGVMRYLLALLVLGGCTSGTPAEPADPVCRTEAVPADSGADSLAVSYCMRIAT